MASASKSAMNESSGSGKHRRQATGGCLDDTPGQVDRNVSARVLPATPHRLDSMGGSEHRGRNNSKRG